MGVAGDECRRDPPCVLLAGLPIAKTTDNAMALSFIPFVSVVYVAGDRPMVRVE
jgi:hypothetical protein